MKIVHANKFYFPKRGADRYFFDLTTILEKRGHEVIPFSMRHPSNRKTRYKQYFVSQVNFNSPTTIIEKIRVLGRMMYSFEARRRFKELLAAEKPNLVHIENIYHQISPSILGLAKKKYQVPVVQTVHDLKLMCPNFKMYTQGTVCERCKKHKFYNAIRYRCMKNSLIASLPLVPEMYFHKAMKFYEKNVDVFIAPSNFMKRKMVEWGMPKEKIVVIHNFVDTNFYKPAGSKKGYILYAGALEAEKGVGTLIRAMKRSKGSYLKIAGGGSQEEYFKKLAQDMGVTSRVEFLGNVIQDPEAERELMKHAKLVVISSELYENSPLIGLKSLACGTPIVGSDIGGIPEFVDNEKNGKTYRVGDHIHLAKILDELQAQPTVLHEMEKNARVFAEARSFEAYGEKIDKLYKMLLEKKNA